MPFWVQKDHPQYDLLTNLRDALHRIESDPDANTPSTDNLKRILRDRIAVLESEAKKNQ